MGHGCGYFALVWSSGGGLSRNIVGGAGALIDGLAAELGGRVQTGTEVLEVADDGERVRVRYRQGGAEHTLLARHAIVATKAFDAARLIRDLPAETSSALNAIPYGPTVVMAMLTNETRAKKIREEEPHQFDNPLTIDSPGMRARMGGGFGGIAIPRAVGPVVAAPFNGAPPPPAVELPPVKPEQPEPKREPRRLRLVFRRSG